MTSIWSGAAIITIALGAALRAQDVQPFGEQVEVQIVEIDVVVGDARGEPVRGLTAGDFTVLENGTLREITHFESIDVESERRNLSELPKR